MLIALRFNLRVDYKIKLPQNKAINQHSSIKHSKGFIILQRVWILQNIEHHLVQQFAPTYIQ